MALPTVYDICVPREDVLQGSITESDFAADLAQVLRGDAPEEYTDPGKFFANTYPTRGLKALLVNVCHRLNASSKQIAAIFRLDTNYGGGKTHDLVALKHAAQGMQGVVDVSEFISPDALVKDDVRIAAFDGENADPTNGRNLGHGLRAYTPWGEIAYALNGVEGYELVRRSDQEGVAPGSETIKELFGGQPTLILLDELSVYLRKLKAKHRDRAGGQLTAFLTSLFKAVESTNNAALVYTLAIGKGGVATDAYSEENQFIADKMEEAESVSARKATLINPTEEDETVKILQRRLFASIDQSKAQTVIEAYRQKWSAQKEHLPAQSQQPAVLEAFERGYPLHPELIDTLQEKTSTLGNFQRVRGMLRILAKTVSTMWAKKPSDAYAVHLHHVDISVESIRNEVVNKLGQQAFVPALRADVAAVKNDQPSLAQDMDAEFYTGLPPYGSHVARTVFFHTLAFNESLKGATQDQVRFSILSPGTDISFIDDAIRRFVQTSAYLDDRPNAPLRILTEANLTQMVRRQERQVDPGEARAQLNDRIKSIFGGQTLSLTPFPSMPNEIPDDGGEKAPYLALINYDAAEVSGDQVQLPDLIRRLFREKGSSGDLRISRNALLFLIVDAQRKEDMKKKMVRRLALEALRDPQRQQELAEYQQDRLKEWYRRSEQELALAIQQAYRHVFYPSRNRVEGADVDLGHTVIEVQNASETPGNGQKQVVRVLRDMNKLRLPDDQPDSPIYIRDRTPLKKGRITTAALRSEFRRDPSLPMLVGDDVFIKGIRQGIEQGEFVYKSGDLLWGKGDPWADIKIDEQSYVFTTTYARENDIWPRPEPKTEPPSGPQPESGVKEGPGITPPSPETGTGGHPGAGSPGPEPQPTSDNGHVVQEEGVLKEALTKVWEKARSRKYGSISSLTLKLYDPSDGFKLLGLVGSVPRTEKQVSIQGEYETTEGSELSIEFKGKVQDAQPVKDFLDPQLRAARDKDVNITFDLTFNPGLSLHGEEPENISQRLTKFGTGACFVLAIAEASS
jgi:hypothetical protein